MIPTYRPDEDYLRATLESVLREQDPSSTQIEVVDDSSPGVDVSAIVADIAGSAVRVFRNPRNLGLAGSWNTCVSRARGQFVHILHQDDLVLPGFYRALQAGFDSDPKIGAAFCRHFYFDQDDHWQYISDLEARKPGVLPGFLNRISLFNTIQCPSIAVRKSVYDHLGGFRRDLPHSLDWEMWVRISEHYGIYYEPRILAGFRVHSGSTTARQARTGEQLTDIFQSLRRFSSHVSPAEAARARLHYAARGIHTVRQLINERQIKSALINLRIILQNCRHPRICYAAARMGFKLLFPRGKPNLPASSLGTTSAIAP
jgi:hypothetical protein